MQEASDRAGEVPSAPLPSPQVMDPAHLTARSHPLETCPFFRADHGGLLGPPIEAPDRANRCIAVGAPQPQSARQQEFVCLTVGHGNCPLFHQGMIARRKAAVRAPVDRGPSKPVIVSALTLVAAAAASVGFLLVRGGLTMPVATPLPSAVAVVSQAQASAAPAPASSSPVVTVAPPTASPTPSPSATPSPSPSPSPTASPTSTPSPSPALTPPPTSDRYALLKPCPGTKNCWIYTVRSGDNLRSIVNYFGVPYGTVLNMNPRITDPTTIRAGDQVRMPPPTR